MLRRMPRRAYVWILGLPLIVTALLAGESCTNSKPATGLGAGCSINSDCSGSLICAYGLCHVACVTSKDCSSGETCLPPGECELPQEATCSSTVPCVEGLVCANDTCKAPCTPGLPTGSAGGCLGGQTCSMVAAATDSVCLDNGDGGAPDGATGGDGSSSGGDGSSGSDGTMTGGDGSPCTSPETTFGLIGQGDSNPNFGSAVGALGTNVMYILSGYSATAADGGTSTAVYVQAFDPRTGASKGPAQQLFVPPELVSGATIQFITLYSAAVSPTGEIALVYYMQNVSGVNSLCVAFLSPSTGSGSVAGLQFQQAVQVSGSTDWEITANVPGVIWSNASQAFLVSYMYGVPNGLGYGMSVNKFTADGQVAPGSFEPAPALAGGFGSQALNGNLGESGNLLAVSYIAGSNGTSAAGAWVSILDESGNLEGSPTELVAEYNGDGAWVTVAGTAQGFVYFYDELGYGGGGGPGTTASVGEVFLSTSPDGGIVGGDISGEGGVGAFPGFSFPAHANFGIAVADDVGTGGSGGVGVVLQYSGGTVGFAYVGADGIEHQGPFLVLSGASGGTVDVALTNLNGSFAVSAFSQSFLSTQVVASGICP
jgi:hypothetical protein